MSEVVMPSRLTFQRVSLALGLAVVLATAAAARVEAEAARSEWRAAWSVWESQLERWKCSTGEVKACP